MAIVNTLKSNFTAGEISPQCAALVDLARYQHGAKRLTNWQILVTGGVTRRKGFRYVAPVGNQAFSAILKPFEPSTSDAYVLEFGELYIRFFKDGAYLNIQIDSPYHSADLRQLRTAQVNDVMLLTHPSYAPRRLVRTAPTTFVLSVIPFNPPPTFEGGVVGVSTLTLSGTTGSITLTAGLAVFSPSDVQRQVQAGIGRAIITAYTSGTVATAIVVDAFASTSLPAFTWFLRGTTVAQITPSDSGPVGAQITLSLGIEQPGAANLVSNGDFATGLTSWTDYSSAVIVASGAHGTPTNSVDLLVDAGADFVAAGVLTTQTVRNTTDGSSGVVSSVAPQAIGVSGLLFGGTDNDFDEFDLYEIHETGASRVSGNTAELNGGTAGHGWIEQVLTGLTVGTTYRLAFTVTIAPMGVQVGTAQTLSDLYAEASFDPGEQSLTFTATTAEAAIQFRNNQNRWAGVSAISVRPFTIAGFRPEDVGKYARFHGGLALIRVVNSGSLATAEVIKEFSSDDPAAPGAWSLEEPSWSATLGWPSSVVLCEDRLYFAGTARFKQTVWGSAVDDFFNFALGANAADAVQFSIVDSGGNVTLNQIHWLLPAENLLAGTSHGEYRIAGSGDDPISAVAPPRARPQSTYGSDEYVMPIKIDQSVLFMQRKGSKLRRLEIDPAVATRFKSKDLTLLREHLFAGQRILELHYAAEPLSTLYLVRQDGVMLAVTYDVSEEVEGWYTIETQGAFESACIIPHPTENKHQLWAIVRRGGGPSRYIEIQDDEATMTLPTPIDGETIRWTGLTVDSGKSFTGTPFTVFSGLAHLEGQTVDMVGDGAVFPPQVVVGGTVTFSQAVSSAFVGLHFDSLGTTLRPEVPLVGTSQRAKRSYPELVMRLFETIGLTVDGTLLEFRDTAHPMDQGIPPFTGDVPLNPFGGFDTAAEITFHQTQPFPATVLGIIGLLDTEAERG